MSFLVTNCYDWVGFHIVNQLLENGYEVDGINNSSNDPSHLAMFLGRNSSFTLTTKEKMSEYDFTFVIKKCSFIDEIKSKLLVEINIIKQSKKMDENFLFIKQPLLFGEWMPMNNKGMYYNKNYILFNSSKFQTEAIYIKDFIHALLNWINQPSLSTSVVKDSNSTDKKFVKNMYFRNNESKEVKLKNVLEHYKRYKDFY